MLARKMVYRLRGVGSGCARFGKQRAIKRQQYSTRFYLEYVRTRELCIVLLSGFGIFDPKQQHARVCAGSSTVTVVVETR